MAEHEETTSRAAERDAQGNLNMDDINIPLVAVSVVFFGALLAVTIAALQAYFSNEQAAERAAKMLPRDAYTIKDKQEGTELGNLWHKQRTELNDPNNKDVYLLRYPTTNPAPIVPKRMTIDEAMQQMAKEGG